MKCFTKNILRLAEIVGGIETKRIEQILEKYQAIPTDRRSILELKKGLREKEPYLFRRDIIFDDGKIIGPEEQEKNKREIFAREGINSESIPLEKILFSLEEKKDEVEEIKDKMRLLFPEEHYEHFFRIKNFESSPPDCRVIDVVGLRIALKKSYMISETILKFEKEFKDRILFKLNTFPLNKKELSQASGRNSSLCYRAIHYYLAVGCLFVEIQMRTEGIDLWSRLQHDTIYKPKINVGRTDKNRIMKFGKISNIVDYFEIIHGK